MTVLFGFDTRPGAGEVRQPGSVLSPAHRPRAQHLAVPVPHGSGQRQGSHRVHWAGELRPFHDRGE